MQGTKMASPLLCSNECHQHTGLVRGMFRHQPGDDARMQRLRTPPCRNKYTRSLPWLGPQELNSFVCVSVCTLASQYLCTLQPDDRHISRSSANPKDSKEKQNVALRCVQASMPISL